MFWLGFWNRKEYGAGSLFEVDGVSQGGGIVQGWVA